MLYEALTGRQPFKGDTAVATAAQRLDSTPQPPRALAPDIPRGLDAIVMRAMARNPEDRFLSAGAFADALAAFADQDQAHTAALPLATAHRATRQAARATPVTPPQGFPEPPPRQRRDLRWLYAVVGLLVLAGLLVAVALSTGMFEPGGIAGPDEGRQTERAAADSAPLRLDGDSLASFDPEGGDGENDDSLPALVDDQADTTWRTDIYNTAEFGGLKDGVGFTIDLGDATAVSALEFDIVTPGLNFTVLAADEIGADVSEWDELADVSDAGDREAVQLDEPIETRFLLVWLTAPLPDAGGYKAEFSEVRVLAPESRR